mgnify:CR=1 FL=1
MGFFNLYKPREYKYRYIYYDPKKEEKRAREKQESGEYKPVLRRGVFREMANKNKNMRVEYIRKSNIRLVVILAIMLALIYFLLS